jgi:hypothetical protein
MRACDGGGSHVYNNGAADAPVQIDMFVDLLCPYSKQVHAGRSGGMWL